MRGGLVQDTPPVYGGVKGEVEGGSSDMGVSCLEFSGVCWVIS